MTTLLYVEDEPDIRAVAQMALEALGGFTLQVCESGAQALDALQTLRPDAILLDVMMPGMDGPATFRALRDIKGCETIPVIFMTAKVQPSEVESYRAMGAIGVISKPFDPMQLPNQIKALLHV